MCVCLFFRAYVCLYVHVCIYVCVYTYVCIYVCMYVCMHSMSQHMSVYTYLCGHMYMNGFWKTDHTVTHEICTQMEFSGLAFAVLINMCF